MCAIHSQDARPTDATRATETSSKRSPCSPDAFSPTRDLLKQTTAAFEAIGIPLARRWAETLIAAVLDVPHEELQAHAGWTLSPEQRRRFEKIARQASPDVPLAYEIGRAPFLDLDFEVSRDTLIPKVDTELFAGIVLDELARRPLPPEPHVLELGTGSGCLAISLAKRLPDAWVVATDVSPEALAVARRNVARHGVEDRLVLGQGDMWEPVAPLAAGRPFDLVVSNPPYIPTRNIVGMGRHVAEYEPHLALDGGAGGRTVVPLVLQKKAAAWCQVVSCSIEDAPVRVQPVRALAGRHPGRYDDVRTLPDANGKDRALHARRRAGSL